MYRPALAEPPLASVPDLERLSLSRIADLHELLDLRDLANARALERQAQKR